MEYGDLRKKRIFVNIRAVAGNLRRGICSDSGVKVFCGTVMKLKKI